MNLTISAFVVIASFQLFDLISIEFLRMMASLASCTILLKVFDWLLLFEDTAFYILLLEQTIKGISHFLILLVIALSMFGIPLVILNQNRKDEDDKAIIESLVNFWVFDMLVNQYLLALGEFSIDKFASGPQTVLCYAFFIAATFIT